MEAVVLLAAIALLASKSFELIKRVKAKDANGALSIIGVWIAGFAAVALAAHAVVTEGLTIPGSGVPLGMLDWPSQVLLGCTLSSFGAVVKDFRSAIDNTDSQVQPKLLDGSNPPPPQ